MSSPDAVDAGGGTGYGPSSVLLRAEALAGFGRLDDAISELRRGIAEFPDAVPLWSALCWHLYRSEAWEAADDAAGRALALDPDDTAALQVHALLAVRDRAVDRAHATVDRLIAIVPEEPTPHLVKALAFAAEPNGARRHRVIIRNIAYHAMNLAPEDPDVICLAARVLQGITFEQEVRDIVQRGLAVAPQHEGLLMQAAIIGTKTDSAEVEGMTRVLAQNPLQADAAMNMSHIVWTRTRWVAALAVWGMAGIVVPQVAIGLVIASIVNLWILVVQVRRAAPRGFLRRTWGASRGSAIGVALCFIGLAWPIAAFVILGSGVYRLLALPPLVLLVGETLVVLAMHREERRLIPRTGSTAEGWAKELRRAASKGWFRIGLGAMILVIGAAWFVLQPTNEMGPVAISIGLAFAVPPFLMIVLRRRLIVASR